MPVHPPTGEAEPAINDSWRWVWPPVSAPEAVADIIAYLVSDTAAPVSGAVVPADGA